MKQVIIFVIITMFLLNVNSMGQTVLPEMDYCFLKEILEEETKYIKRNNMIDVLKRGGDQFYSPAFFYYNFGLLHNLDPKQYNEEIWAVAIITMGTQYVKKIEKEHTDKIQKLIFSIADTLEEMNNIILEDLLEDLKSLHKFKYTPDWRVIQNYTSKMDAIVGAVVYKMDKFFRDILVNTGVYKSKNANVRWAAKRLEGFAERLSGFLDGILISLSAIEDINKIDNVNKKVAELMVKSSLLYFFTEDIIKIINSSGYNKENQSLNEAINNINDMVSLYRNKMIGEIIWQNVVIEGSLFLISLKIGALVGTIVPGVGTIAGAVAGLAIGLVLDKWIKEGNEFIFYFDVSSALLTLSIRLTERGLKTKGQIFLANLAYITAVDIIKNNVIGKGITSTIGDFTGGNETKWKDYWGAFFNHYKNNAWPKINNREVLVDASDLNKNIKCNKKLNYHIFVIDVSGSMNNNNKLNEVKKVLPQLVSSLPTKNNMYALIVYSSNYSCTDGKIIVPFTADKDFILTQVHSLKAGGGTPMLAGLQTAFELAREIPAGKKGQIFLLCDGEQNCPTGSIPALSHIILRKYGIYGRLQLTQSTLNALKQNKAVPDSIIAKLKPYTNKIFNSTAEYDSVMSLVLGENKDYKKHIDLYMGLTDLPATISTLSLGKGVDVTLQRIANQSSGFYIDAQKPEELKEKMRKLLLQSIPSKQKAMSLLPYLVIFLPFLFL